MTESLMSDRFGLPFLAAGQSQKEITHNEALLLIDILLHPVVENIAQAAVPDAPVAGQCWVVASGATGEWSDKENMLACYTSGGWRFLAPCKTMMVNATDNGRYYGYDGTEWALLPMQHDGYYVSGKKIIGGRAAAISPPDGGSVVDAEMRAAFVQLLLRLREHGLIETI